jgi:hypothetical protein
MKIRELYLMAQTLQLGLRLGSAKNRPGEVDAQLQHTVYKGGTIVGRGFSVLLILLVTCLISEADPGGQSGHASPI